MKMFVKQFLFIYSVYAATWHPVSLNGSYPSFRSEAGSVWIPSTNKILLVGGDVGGDSWLFDVTTQRWSPLASSTTVTRRYGHSLVSMLVANSTIPKVYLYGGKNDTDLNDLWEYLPLTQEWILITPAAFSLTPPVLSNHISALTSTGKLLIFGGTSNGTLTNLFRQFDFTLSRWTVKTVSGTITARQGMAAAMNSDDVWYIYGGQTLIGVLRLRNSSPTPRPTGRVDASGCITSQGYFVIYGGFVGSLVLNELWAYLPATNTWYQQVLPLVLPRRRSAAVSIDADDNLFVFSGRNNNGLLNDMFYIDSIQIGIAATTTRTFITVSNISAQVATDQITLPSTTEVVETSTSAETEVSPAEAFTSEEVVLIFEPDSLSSESTSVGVSRARGSVSTSTSIFLELPILTGGIAVFVLLAACHIFLFCRSRRKKKRGKTTVPIENSSYDPSMGTSMGSSANDGGATSIAGATIMNTLMNTSMGLSIPGYLSINLTADIKPLREIARGGFGRVIVGEVVNNQLAQKTGPQVIVKEMLSQQPSQPELQVFYQELAIMNLLKDKPNIAQLEGYSESPYALVLKFYPNGSLADCILGNTRKTKAIVLNLITDVAKGISQIYHAGIAHCDLKPPNVLMDVDEVNRRLKCVITDFGIAQVFDSKVLLVKQFAPIMLNGASLAYSAPEALAAFRNDIDMPTSNLPPYDVFSCGVILRDIMTRTGPSKWVKYK